MARKLGHLLRALAVQVVEVPHAHAGRVAALPRGQVAAVRAERHAGDGLAWRVQHVALPVLPGVEQDHGASCGVGDQLRVGVAVQRGIAGDGQPQHALQLDPLADVRLVALPPLERGRPDHPGRRGVHGRVTASPARAP